MTTTISPSGRYSIVVKDDNWQNLDNQSARLRETIEDLLLDWGAYLDTALYFDAICHFAGGMHQVLQPVDIFCNGQILGKEKFSLLNEQVAFEMTAIKRKIGSYEHQLRMKLAHTELYALQ